MTACATTDLPANAANILRGMLPETATTDEWAVTRDGAANALRALAANGETVTPAQLRALAALMDTVD